MKRKLLFAALAIAALVPAAAVASDVSLEHAARFTFTKPVEIPGKVLAAGSYIFEDVELGKLTRVWNADGRHLIGIFDTVPFEQVKPAPEKDVVLKKGPDNSPARIDTWFYPGDSIGSEFVYPRG